MVVVDAGVILALLVPDPHQGAVVARFRVWLQAGEAIHAPGVMPYEVLNVLARQVWDKAVVPERAAAAWSDLGGLGIEMHPFDPLNDGPRSLAIARQLRRRHATDCAYVALAERLGAEVWTIDEPLWRAARAAGLPVRRVS